MAESRIGPLSGTLARRFCFHNRQFQTQTEYQDKRSSTMIEVNMSFQQPDILNTPWSIRGSTRFSQESLGLLV